MFQVRFECDFNVPRIAQNTPSGLMQELRPEPLVPPWLLPFFLSPSVWSICKSHWPCLQNTPGSEHSSLLPLPSSGPQSLSALAWSLVRAFPLVTLFPHLPLLSMVSTEDGVFLLNVSQPCHSSPWNLFVAAELTQGGNPSYRGGI